METSLEIGSLLDGKYRIEDVVGRGGMGVVYRATHEELGAVRAVKVMNHDLTSSSGFRRRFLNEARLAARLRHENLVALYDLSKTDDGLLYIVWELLEGETLARTLQDGKVFGPWAVAEIVGQVADGMTVAHREGIIHGDLSPDNLMLVRGREGAHQVKVLDFGMAKMVAETTPVIHSTTMGMALGKIGYSSPEQVTLLETGYELDQRSDVFSLAVVAYRMLVGRVPFRTSGIQAFVFDVAMAPESEIRARYERTLPAAWRKPLSRALRRDRNARTSTMEAFKRDLEEAALRTPADDGAPDKERVRVFVAAERREAAAVGASGPRRRRVYLPRPERLLFVALAAFLFVVWWGAGRSLHERDRSESSSVATNTTRRAAEFPPESRAGRPHEASSAPAGVAATTSTPPATSSIPSTLRTLAPPPQGPLGSAPMSVARATTAVVETQVVTLAEQSTVVEPEPVTATPAVGHLAVTADVWTEVRVDGGPVRQTPVVFRHVPVGDHVLVVQRPGYLEQRHRLVIEEDRTTRLRLKMRKLR